VYSRKVRKVAAQAASQYDILFVMFFDKFKHIALFEPDYRFNPLFAFAWAIPPDTWQLSPVREFIDQRQTAFKKVSNLFGCEQRFHLIVK
jgi:hypothetical protein